MNQRSKSLPVLPFLLIGAVVVDFKLNVRHQLYGPAIELDGWKYNMKGDESMHVANRVELVQSVS